MLVSAEQANAPARWRAELKLAVKLRHGQSQLVRESQRGPLTVQRPFYPEGASPCHIYVLHPPGGIVYSDLLSLSVRVEREAAALLTTPAATKIYRSPLESGGAEQAQRFSVGPGASLEWLPQETIAFSGARAQLSTEIELANDARLFGCEILCLGRPARGERFTRGRIEQRILIRREGRLIFFEHNALEPGPRLDSAFGLAGAPCIGTFYCVPSVPLPESLRALERPGALHFSRLEHAVVGRAIGASATEIRGWFAAAWGLLRPALLGRPRHDPRIWAT